MSAKIKRKHPRTELNLLADRHDLERTEYLGRGRFSDISQGGAQYKEISQLAVGERYRFRFELAGEKLFLVGEILRAWHNKYENWWHFAVKFDLSPQERERLDLWLTKHCAKKKRT